MTAWTVAGSLTQLRAQVDALAPARDRHADGTIGDQAHQAQSWSDHNPDAGGVVRALDITHDPEHLDAGVLAAALAAARDTRIKYVIWNRRVLRSYPKLGIPAWTWSPYTGDNPHTTHVHVSVTADAAALSRTPWDLTKLEDAMPLTNADLERIVAAVWASDVLGAPAPSTTNPHWTPSSYLRETYKASTRLAPAVAALTAKVDALAAQVDALTGKGE